MDIARARLSSCTRSATIPGALEIMTLPKKAPMKRTMMSSSTDLLSAQGIIRTVKTNRQPTETGLRPYISLIGAMNIDPMARPTR